MKDDRDRRGCCQPEPKVEVEICINVCVVQKLNSVIVLLFNSSIS